MTAQAPLHICGHDATWRIDGELARGNAAELYHWCMALPVIDGPLELELGELEISDGEAAVAAIDVVRLLLKHNSNRLILRHAPHTLAHTLYRIGMLESAARLTLIEPRQEEPYG